MDETYSLIKTVEILIEENSQNLDKIIIVSSKFSSLESIKIIDSLSSKYEDLIDHIIQIKPFLGGALQDAIANVKSDYFILMASDLETDPFLVKKLISESISNKDSIIVASRWRGVGSGFKDYSKVKLFLNKIFQNLVSILFRKKITDYTYAFRIYPTFSCRNIIWKEFKHPFLLEVLLKPIRKYDLNLIEVPAFWSARVEGKSNNNFMTNFLYFKTALNIFFEKNEKIHRNNNHKPTN